MPLPNITHSLPAVTALSCEIVHTEQVAALRFGTQKGMLTVLVPMRSFWKAARGDRDANGRPWPDQLPAAGKLIAPAPQDARPAEPRPVLSRAEKRARALALAREWLANPNMNRAASIRASGLDDAMCYQALRFAEANPGATVWPYRPIGAMPATPAQIAMLRQLYPRWKGGASQRALARESGLGATLIRNWFLRWRAEEEKEKAGQ